MVDFRLLPSLRTTYGQLRGKENRALVPKRHQIKRLEFLLPWCRAKMSMVEVHLPQPLFALSNECVTQRSRLRVLLHFADNTYNFDNFGVFVSVWQTAILLSVELSEKRKS